MYRKSAGCSGRRKWRREVLLVCSAKVGQGTTWFVWVCCSAEHLVSTLCFLHPSPSCGPRGWSAWVTSIDPLALWLPVGSNQLAIPVRDGSWVGQYKYSLWNSVVLSQSFFFFFLATLCGKQDFSSMTRDWTVPLAVEALDCQGNPQSFMTKPFIKHVSTYPICKLFPTRILTDTII